MKQLIFFCIASSLLLFSIIVIHIAPIIGKLDSNTSTWFNQACEYHSDNYNYNEEQSYPDSNTKEKTLKPLKKIRDRCKRKKAMVSLEYTAFNIDLFFGFICALIGLLVYLNIGNLGKIIGLIGIGGGVLGFVLTLVYVIESLLVFNDIEDDNSTNVRIDSDGGFLLWDSDRYKCIFYDKNDKDSLIIRFSDYRHKYLNYNKDIQFANSENHFKIVDCSQPGISYDDCKTLDEAPLEDIPLVYAIKRDYSDSDFNPIGECNKLLYYENTTDNKKKIIYDRWLTTIILSFFILIINIGLALFGFFLIKDSNKSSDSKPIIKSSSFF